MKYRLGSVPYLNAKPLVKWLERHPDKVEVIFEVPSKLPSLLHEGKVDAILASSVESLRSPNIQIAEGIGISSWGPVMSTEIFCKFHPAISRTLALDESSLTTNLVAQLVLIENYNLRPKIIKLPPNLNKMFETCDAAVLIGDNCLKAQGKASYEMDLGEEWDKMTHLPFIWALWMGKNLNPELVFLLQQAKEWGIAHLEEIAEEYASKDSSIPKERCIQYLTKSLKFHLTERHLEGLCTFQRMLLKNGLLSEAHFPKIISAAEVYTY